MTTSTKIADMVKDDRSVRRTTAVNLFKAHPGFTEGARLNVRSDFGCGKPGEKSPQDWVDFCNSIREHGLQQPIVCMPIPRDQVNGSGARYWVIAGERRLSAVWDLHNQGYKDVEVLFRLVHPKDESEVISLMLLENIQRKDLSPLEKAEAILSFEKIGKSDSEIAQLFGKSQSWVSQYRQLAKAAPEVKKALAEGKIVPQAAMEIGRSHDKNAQADVLAEVLRAARGNKGASVRAAKELSGKGSSTPSPRQRQQALDFFDGYEGVGGLIAREHVLKLLVTVMKWTQGQAADRTLKMAINEVFDGQLPTGELFTTPVKRGRPSNTEAAGKPNRPTKPE